MLAALRYRRAQALAVVALAALVSACLVLAPLYTRAVEQASVRTTLASSSAADSGLRLASSSSTQPALALAPEALAALVPDSIRGYFGEPVAAVSLPVRRMPLLGEPGGLLLARTGMCEHVRLTTGRCPTATGEIAVSVDQARVYGQAVGATFDAGEFDEAVSLPDAAPRRTLEVVGTYEQLDQPYWFGDRLTGQAAQRLGYDTMLTPSSTLSDPVTGPDGQPVSWFGPRYAADLPLVDGRVGIDEIGPLGDTVEAFTRYPLGATRAGSPVAAAITVSSRLTAIADEVRVGSEQAGVTIPLLMAQMELLLACVLWLVLVAAADQRRGEVAVARLSGRGSRGAARLLLAETLPPILVGVPLGALLAVGVSSIARHTLLTGDPPFEVPLSAVLALIVALLVMVVLALLSVRRVSREPVSALLRSVPPRRTDLRLGVLEAMLVAASVAAFVALVSGSVGGPVGQAGPTLLALAVGVAAARAVSSLLALLGRVLLRRGRATSGVAFLAASRRGTTRWLVPVVTVALCIVVVTTDALAVGERNWSGRAAAEVGAATVLTLDTSDLAIAAAAVRAVDPAGTHLTPVVVVAAPANGAGVATVGVDPTAFRRIAAWPGVAVDTLPWSQLTVPSTAPLVVTGTRVTYRVETSGFTVGQPALRPPPTTLVLGLRVVRSDGSVEARPLGLLPADGVDADQVATVPCGDGCRVTGIGVLSPRGSASVSGSLTLSGLAVDGRPVALGDDASWRDEANADTVATGTFAGDTVRLDYTDNGLDPTFVTQASVPLDVPALTTAPATPGEATAAFDGSYVDGTALPLRSVGRLPFVPGGPTSASVVDIDNLLAQGWRGRGSAVVSAYADRRDPAYLAEVTSALAARGVRVEATSHPETVAASYRSSPAAWSLQLALALAVLSLLVAAVAILVLASTSARARTRDYAALRLVGQRRRRVALVAQLETLPVVVVSCLLGAAVGLWAAPPAVGMVPLFTTTPATFPVDLGTAWGVALTAAGVGLAALVATGVVTSRRVARGADVQRLRETP